MSRMSLKSEAFIDGFVDGFSLNWFLVPVFLLIYVVLAATARRHD
jgi:hypothetical protein